jgi:hypothetical protein
MAHIFQNSTGTGGGTPINTGVLETALPIQPTLQSVQDQQGNVSNLELGTEQARFTSNTEQCPLVIFADLNGGGISLNDANTTNEDSVGIGAFVDDLCFRAGGSPAGQMRLLATGVLTLFGNKLSYFTPVITQVVVGTTLTINNTNEGGFCGAVYNSAVATSIVVDLSVLDGFSMSIIQYGATQITFSTTGGLTLRNRQGHTKTAGQWATCTIFKEGNNLILAGDTAP